MLLELLIFTFLIVKSELPTAFSNSKSIWFNFFTFFEPNWNIFANSIWFFIINLFFDKNLISFLSFSKLIFEVSSPIEPKSNFISSKFIFFSFILKLIFPFLINLLSISLNFTSNFPFKLPRNSRSYKIKFNNKLSIIFSTFIFFTIKEPVK